MAFASVYTNCETALDKYLARSTYPGYCPNLLLSEALGAPRPSVPPISCYAASDRTACAAFIKESRMEFDNATNLDRKSGYLGR
jgi:hypothetical protein